MLRKRFDAIFVQYEAQLNQAQECTKGEDLIIMNSQGHEGEEEIF